ncbi:MAG TPA: MFS transporter [Pseudomonadales bacterium]|nr:MFS transporter [Pseudomonadales bacterium]
MTDDRRSLFRQRSFAGLWWGQVFSITGDRFTYLALAGLFFEYSQGNPSASYAALLALFANVVVAPVLLFAPFTGAWVDRHNLKRVLIVSDVLRALLVFSMPILFEMTYSTDVIFAVVFLLFAVNVIFLPAKSALLPEVVRGDQLLAANSLLAGAGILATAIGALAGGYIIDRFGWAFAMRLDAASYLVSVVGLGFVAYRAGDHHAHLAPVTVRGYAAEVGAGWNVVRQSRSVGAAFLALAAVWFAGGVLHVAGNEHIQAMASAPGMSRLGALLFAIGVGSGIGAWWINTYGKRLPRAYVLGAGLAFAGCALALFAMSRLFAVFVGAAFLIGLFAAPALVLTETALQEGTDLAHRARVFSLRDFTMRLTLLVSVSLAAWAVAWTDTRTTLLGCTVVLWVLGGCTVGLGRRAERVETTAAGLAARGEVGR